jgi:2-dehydropantoate 2-reductase
MRVAFMGSGALGGIIGGRLSDAGAVVLFIARGAQLTAMLEKGLTISGSFGDLHLPKPRATDNPAGEAPVDLVLFLVKGPDSEVAAELISPLVGATTGIISFQNGVSGVDLLAERYGEGAVLPGTTMVSGTIAAPGVVHRTNPTNLLNFGEWNGEISSRAKDFQTWLEKAGFQVALSANSQLDVWTKMTHMASSAAICGLTRLPLRTCATQAETRGLIAEAMREVMALAQARGITIPTDLPEKSLTFFETIDPAWRTSMGHDLETGKKIEIETLSGAVHRLGQQYGVATPVHSLAYRALRYYAQPH